MHNKKQKNPKFFSGKLILFEGCIELEIYFKPTSFVACQKYSYRGHLIVSSINNQLQLFIIPLYFLIARFSLRIISSTALMI